MGIIEADELLAYLENVDNDFPIKLSDKINLEEYVQKLFENNANILYERMDDELAGVVIGYTENVINELAYISIVSTNKKFRGNGIARNLIVRFINKCRDKSLKGVHLYTHKTNLSAINMYKTLGFREYILSDEKRIEDVHFIYYL